MATGRRIRGELVGAARFRLRKRDKTLLVCDAAKQPDEAIRGSPKCMAKSQTSFLGVCFLDQWSRAASRVFRLAAMSGKGMAKAVARKLLGWLSRSRRRQTEAAEADGVDHNASCFRGGGGQAIGAGDSPAAMGQGDEEKKGRSRDGGRGGRDWEGNWPGTTGTRKVVVVG